MTPRWYRDPLLTIANSRTSIVATLVGTVLVFAAAFTLLEQDNPHLVGHSKSGFWVACYWAITTMTTTGYGDVSPATIQGEFLACCLMLWSCFFLLPVVVAHVIQELLHDPDAWTDAEQQRLLTKVDALHEHFLSQTCGDELKYAVAGVVGDTNRCVLAKGHSGPHSNGVQPHPMTWTHVLQGA